ncbi:MAG: S9 family peptidase [Acidobacteria bacterium]|nr:S9 family peptidase [Acidobacteriota bacterium]
MFGLQAFQQASISPDGRRVAWVESQSDPQGAPSTKSIIYVSDLIGAHSVKRVTAGDGKSSHEEHDLAWSPDGKQVAFLSDAAEQGQLQLFVTDVTGNRSRQLTHLLGFLSAPAWSPDGQSIAFLFIEHATRAAGPLVAETPDAGVIDEEVTEQRLTTLDLASGNIRQISPDDLYVYEFDWAPKSQRLVISAAHGSGDDNWYVAGLFSLEAKSGALAPVLEKPGMQIAAPRWSRDGQKIAFIGGLMSDEAIVAGDIYSVAADGSQKTNLTPDMRMSASWFTWLSDSETILFSAIVDGRTGIEKLDLSTHKISELWSGDERVSDAAYNTNLSLAQDGSSSAVIRQSFLQAPEVWAGRIGQWKPITHRNAGLHPTWGRSVSLHWSTDVGSVQGWLTYPDHFNPSRKYPLVVRVHGGPSWAVVPYWPTRWDFAMALPAEGYFVLQPNFRGSYGQGEKFTAANVKDFGYGDLRDIIAGIDAALQAAPIDADRLGITGWSYGGYMAMWAVTQTHRFRASVAGAGISNWLSYYGENKVDQWLMPFMGKTVYDDPELYAKSAPMTFVKNVRTPTLLVVGVSDGECPAPQSYEFWHALKTFGVPTRLVIYPHEGHHLADPSHSRDLIERSVAWFNQYLQRAQ